MHKVLVFSFDTLLIYDLAADQSLDLWRSAGFLRTVFQSNAASSHLRPSLASGKHVPAWLSTSWNPQN